MKHQPIEIHWTAANFEEARHVANIIIKSKLAACAQLIKDITSLYVWKGQLEESIETKVIFKTLDNFCAKIKEIILTHGSYEVPEISKVQLLHVNETYLKWIEETLK